MTNREWMMGLTDEELADEIANFRLKHNVLAYDCHTTYDAVLRWLREEIVELNGCPVNESDYGPCHIDHGFAYTADCDSGERESEGGLIVSFNW